MAIEKEYKKCTKCGGVYPKSERYFYRDRRMRDSFRADCIKCIKKRYHARREKIGKDNPNLIARDKGEIRRCIGCEEWHPATDEYFKMDKDGKLEKRCIKCIVRLEKAERKVVGLELPELKKRYPIGKQITIPYRHKNVLGRVVKHYEHFALIKTRHYTTAVAWTDMGIGIQKL